MKNNKTKICITGHAGFIGSHFIEAILKETDWDVVGIDCLNYSGNLNRLSDIDNWEEEGHRVKFVYHDFRAELGEFVMDEIGEVDYILHMGAETHVDRSIVDPTPFVMTNVVGTMNMLNFARTLPNLKKFIYFSTDEVYGPTIDDVDFPEDGRHAPGNPYSASKAGAEDLCLAYANTYKMPIIITNTMNVVSERQHPEKFFPLVIGRVLKGEEISIHANPELTKAGSRFYLHARNAWAAIRFILEKTNEFLEVRSPSQGRFNIVGDRELDNLEFAQFIAGVMGKPLKYKLVNFHESRPGHDLRYGLTGNKLKDLGFEFPKTFEESITKAIKWYMKPENQRWLDLKDK